MLHQAYQVFQVEVGLGGNIFSQSVVSFGSLTTHGFFRILWELPHGYGVVFHLHPNFDIPLLWEHDHMLMDAVHDTEIVDRREQETHSWYWHYKGVHSIGVMVCSDGLTIDPTMLTKEVGQSSRDLSLQFPIGPDHKLWLKMTHSLTQSGHRLMHPLGRYISIPHRPDVWFVSKTLSSLFLKVVSGGHDMYTLNQTSRLMRYGTTYTYSHHGAGPCLEAWWVTITQLAGSHCKILLIVSLLITMICPQTKQIAGKSCIMGKSIPLETSLDRWWHRGLDLQWSHLGVASDWS
jgi:hypothetical protein